MIAPCDCCDCVCSFRAKKSCTSDIFGQNAKRMREVKKPTDYRKSLVYKVYINTTCVYRTHFNRDEVRTSITCRLKRGKTAKPIRFRMDLLCWFGQDFVQRQNNSDETRSLQAAPNATAAEQHQSQQICRTSKSKKLQNTIEYFRVQQNTKGEKDRQRRRIVFCIQNEARVDASFMEVFDREREMLAEHGTC